MSQRAGARVADALPPDFEPEPVGSAPVTRCATPDSKQLIDLMVFAHQAQKKAWLHKEAKPF